jgi:hypothetical protein
LGYFDISNFSILAFFVQDSHPAKVSTAYIQGSIHTMIHTILRLVRESFRVLRMRLPRIDLLFLAYVLTHEFDLESL